MFLVHLIGVSSAYIAYRMTVILIFSIIMKISLSGASSLGNVHEHCHEEGKNILNCNLSRLNLSVVPRNLPRNTTRLDLSFNRISKLEKDSFSYMPFLKTLLLNENRIVNISTESFTNLNNLHTVNMSSIQLTEELFKTLVVALGKVPYLSCLLLHNNTYRNYHDIKFFYLHNLKMIFLDVYNGFNFPEEFRGLRKLSNLSLYAWHHLILNNDSFSGISTLPIQDLRLHFRDHIMRKVANNYLAPLRDLKRIKIRFGGYYTSIKDVLQSLQGLVDTRIESMDIAFNYMRTGIAQELRKKDLEPLSKICVTKLDLSFNEIITFRSSLLWNSRFADCIESLNLKGNPFIQNNPYIALIFANMKSIKYLNIGIGSVHHRVSSQPDKDVIKTTPLLDMLLLSTKRKILNITINGSASMKKVEMQGIKMDILNSKSTQIIISTKNLKTLDVKETDFDFCAFEIPVMFEGKGLLNLDISGWACANLNPTFLSGTEYFKTLKSFKARGCNFGIGFQNDPKGELLNSLSHLQEIDFSKNDLTTLHENIFHDQKSSLKRIYLDDNRLERISPSILLLEKIEYIGFRNNLLENLVVDEMKLLESKGNISINLEGNFFTCSCENLPTLRWILRNEEKVMGLKKIPCKYSTISLYTRIKSLRHIEIHCLAQKWLPISLSLSISLTISIFGTAIIYRYRFILRFHFLSWTKYSNLSKQPFEKDVFISYAYSHGEMNNDSAWMLKHLYPFLTELIQLDVVFDEKDFDVGTASYDNIFLYMGKCSHIILLISRSFMQFKDAECHMDMAKMYSFHKKRARVIVIFLDGMSREDLPKSLSQIWFKLEFLRWPEKEDKAEMKTIFWEHLKAVLQE